jgi:hypothetical protein
MPPFASDERPLLKGPIKRAIFDLTLSLRRDSEPTNKEGQPRHPLMATTSARLGIVAEASLLE